MFFKVVLFECDQILAKRLKYKSIPAERILIDSSILQYFFIAVHVLFIRDGSGIANNRMLIFENELAESDNCFLCNDVL